MLENIDPGSGQGWSRKFSSRRDATGALSSHRRRDLDLISGAKWPAEGRPRAPPHPQKNRPMISRGKEPDKMFVERLPQIFTIFFIKFIFVD
jgi:hypothetical protein